MFKFRRRREEGKSFYILHQAFMFKLYKFQLALNPHLLVNPLAIIIPQVSMDPRPSLASKKVENNPLKNRKNISVIDSYIDTG